MENSSLRSEGNNLSEVLRNWLLTINYCISFQQIENISFANSKQTKSSKLRTKLKT